MTVPNYATDDFARLVGSKTFCGPNAWKRLMTWLDVDQPFQLFMQDWQEYIAPTYHSEPLTETLPDIKGLLEQHFEHLYPSQFILRLFELAEPKLQEWLLTSLNEQQKQILLDWYRDSLLDRKKGFLVDHWLEAFEEDSLQYKGIPVYTPLRAELFRNISSSINPTVKRLR